MIGTYAEWPDTPDDWAEQVYKPDIANKPEQLYKKPGYDLSKLP